MLRQALHTSIPKRLISRESELEFINSFLKKTMVDMKPASLYMSGAPGTGKTACLTKALDDLKVKGTLMLLNFCYIQLVIVL